MSALRCKTEGCALPVDTGDGHVFSIAVCPAGHRWLYNKRSEQFVELQPRDVYVPRVDGLRDEEERS